MPLAAASRASAIEAEPPEPEETGAKQGERHVLRNDGLPRVVLARAEHDRYHERRGGGVDVDDGAAGEIERAQLAEPASVAHTQWRSGVDEIDQRTRKATYGPKRIRSTIAPEMSAAVIIAEGRLESREQDVRDGAALGLAGRRR